MKKLLKAYGLQTEDDYTLMIRESYTNGQRTQAREQFKAMPRVNRIEFVKNMIYYWNAPQSESILFFNTLLNL